MNLASVNYLAILVAAIAAFVFGAVYYGTLGKPWMKAARIDPATAKMSPVLFITSFICELIMAWVLAGILWHVGAGVFTLGNGLVSGFLLWLGFIVTTVAVNQRYQGFGWDLTIIDSLHWLGVTLIMGAILGWWGA
jgi:hypothetical protein